MDGHGARHTRGRVQVSGGDQFGTCPNYARRSAIGSEPPDMQFGRPDEATSVVEITVVSMEGGWIADISRTRGVVMDGPPRGKGPK